MSIDFSQFIGEIGQNIFSPDRLLLSAVAVFLVCFIGLMTGPRPSNTNPFLWSILGSTLGAIGDRLDKISRSRADLLFRGFLVTVFTLILMTMIGRILGVVTASLYYGDVLVILILCSGLSAGSLWRTLLTFYKARQAKGTEAGIYLPIARTARVDLNATDDHGVARVAMALLPRMLDKNIVTPIFWFILGGLPLFFLSVSVNFLSAAFSKQGFTKGFGLFPLWLDSVMGYIPQIITSLIITLAAILTPTASTLRSLKAWLSRKADSPYAQGGMPLKLFAFALNISIGGPVKDLHGSALQNKWTGPDGATAQIGHHHIKRALYMSIMAHIILVAVLGALYVYIGNIAI